ncbi:MAG TPA: 30S ribosome-binding factor RbfA [Chthoniobacterales bacterium]
MKHRLERVQEVIKRELSDLIHRHVQFANALVTINQVDITPDLKQAHIFVGVMGAEAAKRAALSKLSANRQHLQHELGKRVIIKYTPHLHFKLDESIERGTRILQIMDEVDQLTPPEAGEAGEAGTK